MQDSPQPSLSDQKRFWDTKWENEITVYTPYHLCHFEVPNTVARAVLFGEHG